MRSQDQLLEVRDHPDLFRVTQPILSATFTVRGGVISAGQHDKECETVIAPLKLTFRMSNSLGSATEIKLQKCRPAGGYIRDSHTFKRGNGRFL